MKQWTLKELIELSKQEERPTDRETLAAWKMVRHPTHYGVGSERLKEMILDWAE
jgi:hypothetical protein